MLWLVGEEFSFSCDVISGKNLVQSFERIMIILRSKYGSPKLGQYIRGIINKTGTSQVGAISKAQKAQNIFSGKKLEIFKKKILSENVAQC